MQQGFITEYQITAVRYPWCTHPSYHFCAAKYLYSKSWFQYRHPARVGTVVLQGKVCVRFYLNICLLSARAIDELSLKAADEFQTISYSYI
jgi:hypothetical protein